MGQLIDLLRVFNRDTNKPCAEFSQPAGSAFPAVAVLGDATVTGALTVAGTLVSGVPSGAASGDLSGIYPGPSVAKVNGVAVTGTPSAGQIVTATGAAAAVWASGISVPTAAVNNVTFWSFDPVSASANTQLDNGKIWLSAIQIPYAFTVTNIVVQVMNALTGGVSGQNFAALYTSAGTRVGLTADQTIAWASNNTKVMALTSPYAAAAGSYYVALLGNASGPVKMAAGSSSGQAATSGQTGAPWRFGSNPASATSLPSSITPASGFNQDFPLWVGLS